MVNGNSIRFIERNFNNAGEFVQRENYNLTLSIGGEILSGTTEQYLLSREGWTRNFPNVPSRPIYHRKQ